MTRANRGNVWSVDLGYAAMIRPYPILSGETNDLDRALATLIPHTTSPRGTRYEVALDVRFLRPCVFDAQNPVTVSQSKLIKRLGSLSVEQLNAVEQAARAWLVP